MRTIETLAQDLGDLLRHMLQPANLSTLVVVCSIVYKGFRSIRKLLDQQQETMIKALEGEVKSLKQTSEEKHNELSKEILRLQILGGIDAARLSEREILYFFDKYKQVGGNSFVEEKVRSYIEKLNFGKEVNQDGND